MIKNLLKGLVEPFLEPETMTTTASSEHLKEAARQRRIEVVDTIPPDEEFVVVDSDSADADEEEAMPADEVTSNVSKVVPFPEAAPQQEATAKAEDVVESAPQTEATAKAEDVAETAPQQEVAPKKAGRSVTYRLAKQIMESPESCKGYIEQYLQAEESERNATKLVYLIKTNVAFDRWLRDKAPLELIDEMPIEIWELVDEQLQ